MINSIFLVVLSVIFYSIQNGNAQVPSDQIKSLPNSNNINFNYSMYAGYVTIPGRKYFYWFVEAEENAATAPVILWLNGGPGCSSLLGLFSENGPFQPDENLILQPNPYAWNKLVNVLYVESPAGVGFSKCDNNDCPVFNDSLTASDNYNVVTEWFKMYPSFAQNDFYIMGESYAGHYIPTLALEIYDHMSSLPNQPPQSNFKGFGAGNPLSDQWYDLESNYLNQYLKAHAMISLDDDVSNQAEGNYMPYDVLEDVCPGSMSEYIRFPHWSNDFQGVQNGDKNKRYVFNQAACIQNYLTSYLQLASVQAAIHADSTPNWSGCGGPDYTFSNESMIPIYQTFLMNTNWNIMVYSGDADTVLNFIATERWILDMSLPIVSKWAPWTYNRMGQPTQVAGWNIVFNGKSTTLRFVTIKGAGHMVPGYQPAPALQMLSNFLENSF